MRHCSDAARTGDHRDRLRDHVAGHFGEDRFPDAVSTDVHSDRLRDREADRSDAANMAAHLDHSCDRAADHWDAANMAVRRDRSHDHAADHSSVHENTNCPCGHLHDRAAARSSAAHCPVAAHTVARSDR